MINYKKLIKFRLKEYFLNEEMVSTLSDNFSERTLHTNLLLIATDKDNDKKHYLILGVDLMPIKDYYELGYGFAILDKNLNKIGAYMRSRIEVMKYLPIEFKNKITPKVLEMAKNLIDKNNPNKIYMETYEEIDDNSNSFKRFETISNFLNKIGYKTKDGYPKKNNLNKWEWVFIGENKEESFNEETIFEHHQLDLADKETKMDIYYDKILTKEFLSNWLKPKKDSK